MTQTDVPLFDPASPSFHADRHTAYRTIRDRAPLLELPGAVPTVMVSRWTDVDEVLRDRTVRMQPVGAGAPPWLGTGAAADMFVGQMLFSDPPDHTRMRRSTSPAFRPRTVATLRDDVQAAVDARIAVLREMGSFDAVADFAEHVPAAAVCSILGIPHTSVAINYHFRGTGYSVVDGRRIDWKAGDLLLSAPGWAEHAHYWGAEGLAAFTVQDHPLQIGMESLVWQEEMDGPIIALGSEAGQTGYIGPREAG